MDPDTGYTRPKFELCFLCHDESRLVAASQGYDGYGNGYATAGQYTNFGGTITATWGNGTGCCSMAWNGNLQLYHLSNSSVCHDCHHNVHSNVEAQNTIYGNGLWSQLPSDSHDGMNDGRVDTHLINFGPQATGSTSIKPRWYFDGAYFRCNLQCHGYTMSLCYYQHGASGTIPQWCA